MARRLRTAGDAPSATARSGARRFSYPSTREIDGHPLFRGEVSRWFWRLYTHRLTPMGRWFLWPTIIYFIFGTNSLDLQAYIIVLYVLMLWGLALLLALLLPPRVALEVLHTDRICAGETLPIDITLTQRGRGPGIDLRVLPVRLPLGVDPMPPDGVAAPMLKRGEQARLRLGLCCRKRGVYALKGYRVETDFPFALVNAYRFYPLPRALLVYPRFTVLRELSLPQGYRHNPGGVALKATQGDSFELLGNREYQDGDAIRNINWRATARLQTAIVREYTQEYFLRVGVVLDTHVSKGARAAEQENFERGVSLCAAVSDYMARQDYLVDIFAAGPHLYHLTTGQSLSYLDEILDILACVEANPQEPFSELEPEISQTLGKITLIICVFLDWNEARRQFVEQLTMHGVAVKVIVARDIPCTLDPNAIPGPGGMPVIAKADFDSGAEVL